MPENDHRPKFSPLRRQMNEQIIQQRNNVNSEVHTKAGGTHVVSHFIICFLNWEDKHIYMLKVNSHWREKKDAGGKGPDEGATSLERGGMGSRLHGGTDMDVGNSWGVLSDGFSFFQSRLELLWLVHSHLPHIVTKPFKHGQSKETCSKCKRCIKFWS